MDTESASPAFRLALRAAAALLAQGGLYKTLWDRQQELEHFGTEEVSA